MKKEVNAYFDADEAKYEDPTFKMNKEKSKICKFYSNSKGNILIFLFYSNKLPSLLKKKRKLQCLFYPKLRRRFANRPKLQQKKSRICYLKNLKNDSPHL